MTERFRTDPLGLAATIVAFALINGALLRPFPGVLDQDRLVTLGILENTPFGRPRLPPTALANYPDVFRALREGMMTSLDDLARFTESDVAVTLPHPRSLPAAFVSPNYFDVLGVQPAIGRTFAPEEGRGESAVAIIGHAQRATSFGTRSTHPTRVMSMRYGGYSNETRDSAGRNTGTRRSFISPCEKDTSRRCDSYWRRAPTRNGTGYTTAA
ncbi:MAG TPA: ABC transporter permease [Vicinamibacterales bacterium]|nr:ABC transporter permease [Vicinamibacterales bacterium]